MNFNFPVDESCPNDLRRAFFEALKDPSTQRIAGAVASTASQLSEEFGRIAEMRQAVLLAHTMGMNVREVLQDRLDALRAQRVGMQKFVADLKRFQSDQAERHCADLARCRPLLLEGDRQIEALRLKVRGYERSRESMIDSLRSAGLDDAAIERVGVTPTPDDRAAWLTEIASLEDRIARARAFVASGPLYDVTLFAEGSNA